MKVRKVDGVRKEDLLHSLHDDIFGDTAPQVDTTYGHWWIVYDGSEPVGLAGMTQSTLADNIGYLKRSGILPLYRGRGMQRRLIRVREEQAKRNGWKSVISDTAYHNIHSSNNLARSGYRLFEPPRRWAFSHGLYWIKDIE